MRVVVTIEHRFLSAPDGTIWTETVAGYDFWQRYLAVFDEVLVVARVADATEIPPKSVRADGEGVTFVCVPYYVGPWQYLRSSLAIRRTLCGAVRHDDAVIFRVPSVLAAGVKAGLASGHPYALEVVGDPYDVFSPGAVRHFLRPFFRWWFARGLRKQALGACGAAYVTAAALQRRYPCCTAGSAPNSQTRVVTTQYSSIQLEGEAFIDRIDGRRWEAPFNLIFVGTLAQLYKAPEVLLAATAKCVEEGLDLQLIIVGDGEFRPSLERQATALGLAGRVQFLGQLPCGSWVRAQLDKAHLFVLPSRQEGLPRAMIEAMARALPCIGTDVGGIPELLPHDDIVPAGDVDALARKIAQVLSDPARMELMAHRNFEKAKEYRDEVLRERRTTFYRHVRSVTEGWLRSGSPASSA